MKEAAGCIANNYLPQPLNGVNYFATLFNTKGRENAFCASDIGKLDS
jgi:hypothetical protein